MRDCPNCGTPVDGLVCPVCNPSTSEKPALSEYGKQAALSRELYLQNGPSSWDLTGQQWYNVCRYFRNVARRCARPFADVGEHNPMHAVRPGPLMRYLRSREPGEDDE